MMKSDTKMGPCCEDDADEMGSFFPHMQSMRQGDTPLTRIAEMLDNMSPADRRKAVKMIAAYGTKGGLFGKADKEYPMLPMMGMEMDDMEDEFEDDKKDGKSSKNPFAGLLRSGK
jgi:hypothetical protein